MDEKDFLIFLTLAETGNLTRTAEKLYLTQPALSKRLQNMESELGAPLFLRSKHGVTLTPAGEDALKSHPENGDGLEALRSRIQLNKGVVSGHPADGSLHRLLQLPPAQDLADYTAQYPDVT